MRCFGSAAAAALAMLAASAASPAAAQSSMVNGRPFAEVEGTAALWAGQQTLKGGALGIDAKSTAATIEIGARLASIESGMWGRVGVGGGTSFGGDISSPVAAGLGNKTGYYLGADIGWTPSWFESRAFSFSPFGGIFYDRVEFGADNGANPFSARTTFWAPRVGVAAKYEFDRRWSVAAEAAYLFLGQFKNDSGFDSAAGLRASERSSSGSGYQLQATVDYKIPESNWSVGGGVRWWSFESGNADATLTMPSLPPVALAPTKTTVDSFGGMLRASYGF